MSTISTHLRNFKEPTKDQLLHLFFALPPSVNPPPANGAGSGAAGGTGAGGGGNAAAAAKGEKSVGAAEAELERMEINAVLSLGIQGEEDSYVSVVFCALCTVARVCAAQARGATGDWGLKGN